MASSRLFVFLCIIVLVNICLALPPPIISNPDRPPIYLNPDPKKPYPYCPDGYFRLVGMNVCRMDDETMSKYFEDW